LRYEWYPAAMFYSNVNIEIELNPLEDLYCPKEEYYEVREYIVKLRVMQRFYPYEILEIIERVKQHFTTVELFLMIKE